MPLLPGLVGYSGTTVTDVLDCEETINFIVEKPQSKEASSEDGALLPTPGFTRKVQVAQSGTRGMLFTGSRFFAIIGSHLYEFDANYTQTDRGMLAASDSNPAQMVYNSINGQIGICSGGSVQVFTLATNVLSAALLAGNYTHLAFAGGYGFALQVTTGKTFVSALNDLTSWNVGTFFARGIFGDPPKAIFADENNLVWTLGPETFEVRYNGGGTGDQPWVPLTGLVGPFGIASPYGYGLSSAGNFWVTSNREGLGRFVVSTGAAPQPVGTYAIDSQIDRLAASAAGIGDAEVLLYDQGGHTSATVALAAAQAATPASPCSFNYDIEGKGWTKRGRWLSQTARWDLWAPRVHCLAFGQHIVGERSSGSLWLLDPTVSTDIDGNGIRRMRRTPHLNRSRNRAPIHLLEVFGDIGVTTSQTLDPQLMFRLSPDGGKTWGNEQIGGIGKVGQYSRRCYWTQIGAVPDPVLEFSYADAVPFSLVSGRINGTDTAARRAS